MIYPKLAEPSTAACKRVCQLFLDLPMSVSVQFLRISLQSSQLCASLIFQRRTHAAPSQNVGEERNGSAIHDAKLDFEVELRPGFFGCILCWASKHPHGFVDCVEPVMPQLEPNGCQKSVIQRKHNKDTDNDTIYNIYIPN